MTTPVVNPCSRNGSQSNRKRIPQNKNLLVLPLPRRHAWLAAPAANTYPRNGSQSNRKRIPQNKNLLVLSTHERVKEFPSDTGATSKAPPRAVTLRRHACLTTPVVKPSLLQPP